MRILSHRAFSWTCGVCALAFILIFVNLPNTVCHLGLKQFLTSVLLFVVLGSF